MLDNGRLDGDKDFRIKHSQGIRAKRASINYQVTYIKDEEGQCFAMRRRLRRKKYSHRILDDQGELDQIEGERF